MQRFACLMILCACFTLEGGQVQSLDEPLCKQPWSKFGPLSKNYALGRKEKPDAVYAILKSYVGPNAMILDLGSGTGISTRQLYKSGFKNVIGVDRDPLMIKEAQMANNNTCSIKYIQGDVSMGLPFSDDQFDVVIAVSAFHWFANPSSIKEVARILKQQAYYFVIGSKSRYYRNLKPNPLKENIDRIKQEFGVSINFKKLTALIPIEDLLEEQGFKIIVDATVPYVAHYTKQEYLSQVQSHSNWNLVKESQRSALLKAIDQYLETIKDEQGRIRKEGSTTVILAQKGKKE